MQHRRINTFRASMIALTLAGAVPVLAEEPAMLVNTGLSGSWYEPATAGQGFALEVVPSANSMVGYWYTYLAGGGGREWLVSQGGINGDTATLLVYRAEGGAFDAPDLVTLDVAGSLDLTFLDCLNAVADYNLDDGAISGSIPLQRLTPDLYCAGQRESAHTTFVSRTEAWVDAQGLWLFDGCVDLGVSESHGTERFWFEGNELRFEIEHYDQAGCQGEMDLQEMAFEVIRVGHVMALFDGQPVIANRTTLTDPASGEEVKQIWYFDEHEGVQRMAHGNFSSAPDLLGFPTELHTETFEFQPQQGLLSK